MRAIQFSLLRAARHADGAQVERDLDALLACAEHLASPVSVLHFDLWALCVDSALLALEGALHAHGAELDNVLLARRIESLRPRPFLLESLDWERALGLRTFEWLATQSSAGIASSGASADLAAWLQGFELGRAYLLGEPVAEERLEPFQASLDESTPVTAMLMQRWQDQDQVTRNLETRLALARTALRLLAHERAEWKSLPRELDPWSGAPLAAEALADGGLRLWSARASANPVEQRLLEWILRD